MIRIVLASALAVSFAQPVLAGSAPAHAVAGAAPCGFRYLAHGGDGKTLLSCGAGDLVQRVSTAPSEMRPLPGEFATARAGDILYTETARIAVASATLGASRDVVLADGVKTAFSNGEVLRAYAVGGRTAFCRIDPDSLAPEERDHFARLRGPFAGIPYGAVCLEDPKSGGAFTRVLQRPAGSNRLLATDTRPIDYDLRTEHVTARALVDGESLPIAMQVRLLSVDAEAARLAFPAQSGAARATFGKAGLPMRKDRIVSVPLTDGQGAVTERGLTVRIVAATPESVDYVVAGRFADWFGIEAAPAPAESAARR